MTKKVKLLFGLSALISVVAIIPVTVISCSSSQPTNLIGQVEKNSAYANFWTAPNPISNFKQNDSKISLYIQGISALNQNSPFNSYEVLPSKGDILPPFISNINWPNGWSNNDVTSWTMTGNNTTGIALYTLNFANKTQSILSVSGFMTTIIANTLSGITLTLTNSNNGVYNAGIVPNTPTGFQTAGISSINWNNLNPLYGGGVEFYSIINGVYYQNAYQYSWLITFKNGVVLSIYLSQQ